MSSIAIFIDGGYLEKIMQYDFKTRIDCEKLSKEIARLISPDTTIIKTYYYHSPPYQSNPPTPEESERYAKKESFFTALERIPRYEVRRGRLARHGPDSDGKYIYEQKMVDALLSIDLVKLRKCKKINHRLYLDFELLQC